MLAAHGAVDPEGGWREEWAEVWQDTGAGRPLPAEHPLAAKRAEVDQAVLASLLRLNLARAGRADGAKQEKEEKKGKKGKTVKRQKQGKATRGEEASR